MQYRRTHMDKELTVDYDNTINKWRGLLSMERYSIDKLMLMVHQPAMEISIGDIFKTNQYERENRHAAIIYVICGLTWYIGYTSHIDSSYCYCRRLGLYLRSQVHKKK